MAVGKKKMYSSVGPSSDPTFEQGYENSDMASDHMNWETYTAPVIGPVPSNPHEEVDEVHQGDEPMGMPSGGKSA